MKDRKDIYQITSIILIIDQVLKLIIQHYLKLNKEYVIISKFFSLFYVKNTGAAFSILEGKTTFLIIISVLFIVGLDYFLKKQKQFTKLETISFGLILGGVFGNLIDRIVYHAVIDYLSFNIINYNFPIFNFADTVIVLGIIILLIDSFFLAKNNK